MEAGSTGEVFLLLPWVPLPDTTRVFVDHIAQYLLTTDALCAPEGSGAVDRVLTIVIIVASEVEVMDGGTEWDWADGLHLLVLNALGVAVPVAVAVPDVVVVVHVAVPDVIVVVVHVAAVLLLSACLSP